MNDGAVPRLAVFDLDGTLTRGDTLVVFVGAVLRRHPWRMLRLPAVLLPLIGYACRIIDRGRLKGVLMHLLLAGLERRDLQDLVTAFAREVVGSRLHEEARGTVDAHRTAGDRLVLMSASPDLYVPRIAELLGFDECTCTKVRWNGERLDGRLDGPNCRGAEKSHRLQALKSRHPDSSAIAYGNSSADLDHMKLCEESVYVNPSSREAAHLTAPGLRTVHWH